MRTFEEFRLSRFNEPPYDYPTNGLGFNRPSGSDISAHLPLLQYLASYCDAIVELGTRDCYSTCALLAGKPTVVRSYDIESRPAIEELKAIMLDGNWEFYLRSSVDPSLDIGECTMLFVDTLHTYEQVKEELRLHAGKVSTWIVLHDTFSFPEINQAISEFLALHDDWHEVYRVNFNHGIVILEKVFE